MRLPTVAWFAAGCGLAVLTVMAGRAAFGDMDPPQQRLQQQRHAGPSSLHVATPTPEASSSVPTPTVVPPHPASEVPIQRPAHLRSTSSIEWTPDEARLPPTDATSHWDPDDARIPDGPVALMTARAYWNPDSAALPRPNTPPPAAWDPNDARLPTL